MATTRDRAQDAGLEQAVSILRALWDLRASDLSSPLARELVAHVEGRIGWGDVTTGGDDTAAREEAARAFASLDRPAAAFALMSGLDPRRHAGILGIAVRVLASVAPEQLFAERRWISQLFAALLDNPLRTEIDALIGALHTNGHFDLVDVLRRSRLGEITDASTWKLIAARQACWAGRYADVGPALAGATLSGAAGVEADLCRAIARGHLGDPPSDAEMIALTERAAQMPGLDETIERWRAELLVRARCSDTALVSQSLGRASDHPALHLLYRIADRGAPPRKQSENPTWGFDTYVLEKLADAGVAEAQAALAAYNTPDQDDAFWRVLERLGGNRTDYWTYVDDDGRVRPILLRTARQEAVASQGMLPELGVPAVMARLADLEQRHTGHSVFSTYQAEILLWQGQYAEAAKRFEIEVRRAATRWGEVGLGAALAGLGDEDEAERVWAMGHKRHGGALSGEATWVYKAEIAARRGDLGSARHLLDGVLAAKRSRMRGWILRAEIDWMEHHDDDGRQALLQAIALCPGLVTTVSDRRDAPLAPLLEDRAPASGERDALISWCRTLRRALGGNAGSWLYTWFDAAGTFRAFQRVPSPDLLRALTSIKAIVQRAAD